MLKKILAFMCGVAPFGAFAATDNISIMDVQNVNTDTVTVSDTEIKAVQSGNSLQVSGSDLTGGIALDVAGAMRVFDEPSTRYGGGTLFISNLVSDTFSLQVDGNVNVGGQLVVNAADRTFNVSNFTDGKTFDMVVGSVKNLGVLNVKDVNAFSSGAIETAGNLSVAANDITTGAVTLNSGNISLVAQNTLNMAQLVNNWGGGATIDIAASDVQVGSVVNNGAGTMNVSVSEAGRLHATGAIENKGQKLDIKAGGAAIVVDGTMTNETGNMIVKAGSLTVNGGDTNNPSLVNNADLSITVDGAALFANGISLNMTQDSWNNSFYMNVGSLDLGTGNTAAFFANDLNDYDVIVGTAFDTGNINNGAQNANANMYLAAAGLTVEDVVNNAGTLNLVASGTSDLTAVSVSDKAGATTSLTAGGIIDITGGVTASGTMFVQGQQIEVGSIVGDGGDLVVAGSTGESGMVTISGDVSNSGGTVNISGRQIYAMGNAINNSGTLTIGGSDLDGSAIGLGGLSVTGGATNMNGLLGLEIAQTTVGTDVFGTGTLSVTGGVLNLGTGTHVLTVVGAADTSGYVMTVAGDVIASAAGSTSGGGDIYVTASGQQGVTFDINGAISVGGDVVVTAAGTAARMLNFTAESSEIDGNVMVNGASNRVVFQGKALAPLSLAAVNAGMTDVSVGGQLLASDGGTVEIYSTDISVGTLTENDGLIYLGGNYDDAVQMDVTTGGVSIVNGITFDNLGSNRGLVISNTDEFSLISLAADSDVDIAGGISLGDFGRLNLQSGRDIEILGTVTADGYLDIDAGRDVDILNNVTIGEQMDITAKNIVLSNLTNNGVVALTANGDINVGILENTETAGSLDINAGGDVYVTAIETAAGTSEINADNLYVTYGMDITGGKFALDASDVEFGGDVNVAGVLNQGQNWTGALRLGANDSVFAAKSITTSGLQADSNFVTYNIVEDAVINGDITIDSGATVHLNAGTFSNLDTDGKYTVRNNGAFMVSSDDSAMFDNVINTGALVIDSVYGISMAAVQNSGMISLNSGTDIIDMTSLDIDGGTIQLYGMGLSLASELTTAGNLYQNYTGALQENDIGITADDYVITASNVTVNNVNQVSGTMNILSSDVTVNGNISATDLTIAANPDTDWLDLYVGGSILGNTKILNLEQMTVDGNYVFDSNSMLLAAILPYNVTPGINSTTRNYWSTVSLNNDDTLGQITNVDVADGGGALIKVNDTFTSGAKYGSDLALANSLADVSGQIGLRFQDVSNISAETAIWLLQAEQGLAEFSNLEKIRNLNVWYCNANNTTCALLEDYNLGAYISVRDTDASGSADSLYVVFDPRFGGPVLIENNRIQPIVARQPEYTEGEYVAAGALDNLISGQLLNAGFFNKSPIEVIPVIFEGTNVETLMTELYNRMEYYVETSDGSAFVPFSRLIQPREIEQIVGAIALNEHTLARNFEDRMIDEFIWNRNRNLKKAWADFDFGMFSQNVSDDKRVYGNRFELSGGFDWQESNTLIFGVAGHVSHMSSDNSDSMDLSYLPDQTVPGSVSVDVADTNIGLGAYLMKTLGQKFRAYGNAFVDLHLIDTTRHQTFMDVIEGTGTALALTTEWGLMHDWLNQYIVGNLYVRAGYNFGFSVTEEAAGENYMDLESDGYFMLTPGYSLTAQKRIYPSAWFQIRPYATIGVEYDVLGVPDFARYKFASANTFSDYDIAIDPLWANIGGGFELLSASGLQFGVDYRYQYNNDMQLHNIKISGSYRF